MPRQTADQGPALSLGAVSFSLPEADGDSLMMMEVGWSEFSFLREKSRRCISCTYPFWYSLMPLS